MRSLIRLRHQGRVENFGAVTFGALLVFSALLLEGSFSYSFSQTKTLEASAPKYVGSNACAECHAPAFEAWSNSHHSWATRVPNDKNILGDFNNAEFSHKGVSGRFFKRDGRYFVNTRGADGKARDFEIKNTIGVEPLQQYLLELDKGRLQAFDVAWDTKNKRWFHLFPDQSNKPGDGLHWTGPYKNWQTQCAECHQTQFIKGYNPTKKTYSSSWKELTVGCGSCHGPGEAHITWANKPNDFTTSSFSGVNAKGFVTEFSPEAPDTEIKTCARCHSRREQLGANSPAAGSKFSDNYNLALLRPGLYHADGQINDEVYVYGSFLQSKMHAKGVRCSNCHEPHSVKLKAEGNAVCTQCHSPAGNVNFPTLSRKTYDSTAHHHHEQESVGAECVSCHMPNKTYMIVDPRRDHSFRVPRPDLSVKLGTPNACANCHSEKSPEWAAQNVKNWYPQGRAGTPHFAELFSKSRGQLIDDDLRNSLVELALGKQHPAIIRATSLGELSGKISPQALEKVMPLLKEDEAIIRAATALLFRGSSADIRFQRLIPMLKDPAKSVRIAAVRELLNIPPDSFKGPDRKLVSQAIREYQMSLLAKADFPQTQLAIGGLAMVTRNFKAAEASFREAVAMDPQLVQAWSILARIQLAQSRSPAARKTLLQAIQKNPKNVALLRMFASVSLQLQQMGAAVTALKTAEQLLPDDITLKIELGSAQIQANANEEAIGSLSEALKIEPENADALYLSAHAYLSLNNINRAKELVQRLMEKHPSFTLDQRLETLLQLPRNDSN